MTLLPLHLQWHAAGRRAAAVVLALAVLPAHAQWKWRDKDGRVTVSDRPPPSEIADKDILARPAADRRRALAVAATASAASAAEPPKTALQQEVEARRRSAEQEQATKARAEDAKLAAQRAENCQRARTQQAALESGQRIARVGPNGERIVLDDKGRAEEMRVAREVIASECK